MEEDQSGKRSHTALKTKRNFSRRTSDSQFDYPCEWGTCTRVLPSMHQFNLHVAAHRRSYTSTVGKDDQQLETDFVFYCQWRDCNAEIEGQIEDFSRHVFYHTFHQYLKFLGQHVQTLEKLPGCNLGQSTRNLIPELPETLICLWDGCNICFDNPYIFYSHVTYHGHTMSQTASKALQCKWKGCSMKTKNKYKMKEHLRSHTQAKVIACPNCGSLFASNTKFIDHLRRLGDKTEFFECSHCFQVLASERLLRDHMRHHVNHYKCPICDMTCSSPSGLKDHMLYRHSDERPFPCHMCDFKSKSNADLQKHLQLKHQDGAPTYRCRHPDCSETFSSLRQLRKHFSSAHKDGLKKPYHCHLCKKTFCKGNTLTIHLRSIHDYHWPSGHRKFRYKTDKNGIRTLQTVRYESVEVSEQVLGQPLVDAIIETDSGHQSESDITNSQAIIENIKTEDSSDYYIGVTSVPDPVIDIKEIEVVNVNHDTQSTHLSQDVLDSECVLILNKNKKSNNSKKKDEVVNKTCENQPKKGRKTKNSNKNEKDVCELSKETPEISRKKRGRKKKNSVPDSISTEDSNPEILESTSRKRFFSAIGLDESEINTKTKTRKRIASRYKNSCVSDNIESITVDSSLGTDDHGDVKNINAEIMEPQTEAIFDMPIFSPLCSSSNSTHITTRSSKDRSKVSKKRAQDPALSSSDIENEDHEVVGSKSSMSNTCTDRALRIDRMDLLSFDIINTINPDLVSSQAVSKLEPE